MVCDNSTRSFEAIAFWTINGILLLSLHYAQILTAKEIAPKGKLLIGLRWTFNAIPATVAAYLIYEENGFTNDGAWLILHTLVMLLSCVYSTITLHASDLPSMKIHEFLCVVGYIALSTAVAVYATFERLESGIVYSIVPFSCAYDLFALRNIQKKYIFRDLDLSVPLFDAE
eukprot:TRINITY_DN2362_c0_g1_i1.p1 TRINITY_DN2362_c0_g1~~TRINITY_DN2362_c0_g1_i1.p1  ORF type:complete len:172 (-),score=34.20 TRINITY_DN2362_c0_g1_i1:71-586(-)